MTKKQALENGYSKREKAMNKEDAKEKASNYRTYGSKACVVSEKSFAFYHYYVYVK